MTKGYVIPEEIQGQSLPDGEYAIVEQLGRRTMIGRVVEVERFGTKMLQIEPIWQSALLPPVLISGASLYQLTPISRAIAFKRQATQQYQLPDPVQATLPPEKEEPQLLVFDDGDGPAEFLRGAAINRPIDDCIDVQEYEED